MISSEVVEPLYRWRTSFALFPTFLGTAAERDVWVWLKQYQWRYIPDPHFADEIAAIQYGPTGEIPGFKPRTDPLPSFRMM